MVLSEEEYFKNKIASIKKFDYTLNKENNEVLFEGIKEIVGYFLPEWKDLKFTPQTDGITNTLVLVSCPQGKAIVRVFGNGTEHIIDRNSEQKNFIFLSDNKLAAPIIGNFNNGFIHGYVEGSVFSVPEMSDPHKSILVAKKLGKWHSLEFPFPKKATVYDVIYKWIDEAPVTFEDKKKNDIYYSRDYLRKDNLRKELTFLKGKLDEISSPLAFCHCDLLYGNLIYHKDENGNDDVTFIDYEYGSINPRGFDIGNHFNEFAGFDCDFSLYPSKEFQFKWLKAYLQSYLGKEDVSEKEIEDIYREVNKFALLSHFYWGVWSILQAKYSQIDFDYSSYAVLKLDEYFKNKEKFLAL